MKTPMQELRDKLLFEIAELKLQAMPNLYMRSYREALKNIANDIEAQMIAKEKEVIKDAYREGFYDGLVDSDVPMNYQSPEDYYTKTFTDKN